MYSRLKTVLISVPHCRLISKLGQYGICGTVQNWLHSFLSDQYQRLGEWCAVILAPCFIRHSPWNESVHRASPVHSQQQYIATGLALYKNILLPAIHWASPVYSQMGYIGTGLVYTKSHSTTDGAILLSKLLVQSN